MTLAAVIALTVAALVNLACAALLARQVLHARAEHARSLVGRAVLVSTTGATAVRGVMHADLPDRVTLRDATVLSAGTDAEAPAAGLLHIPRGRVDLVQELAAAGAEAERGS
jgi:hypothetical protein